MAYFSRQQKTRFRLAALVVTNAAKMKVSVAGNKKQICVVAHMINTTILSEDLVLTYLISNGMTNPALHSDPGGSERTYRCTKPEKLTVLSK